MLHSGLFDAQGGHHRALARLQIHVDQGDGVQAEETGASDWRRVSQTQISRFEILVTMCFGIQDWQHLFQCFVSTGQLAKLETQR